MKIRDDFQARQGRHHDLEPIQSILPRVWAELVARLEIITADESEPEPQPELVGAAR